MQRLLIVIFLFVFLIVLTADSHGAIFVDDTWADGTRTNQNLPTESAWFTTSAANMTAYTNMLSITNLPTSSGQWSTYFTSPGNPVHLAVGETMTVTLAFKVTGSAVTNSSQNFRIGLYDSSAGTRLAADGSPNGTSYTGYALFSNFGSTWGRNTGLDHRKRNNTGVSDLLGTSGDSPTLGSGGTVTGTPAFSNDVPYTLTIAYTRDSETSMTLFASYTGPELSNSFSVVDSSNINTNFDCLVIRPSGASTTATNFIFTEFKVVGPSGGVIPPSIVTEPQDITRTVGQTANFIVGATGTTPKYQWYLDPGVPLANATNTSLTLTNLQTTNSGGYFVIVSNSQGSATSRVATLTVNLPILTSPGLVVDDTWEDGDRIVGPVSSSNSVWFASAGLVSSVGSMLGSPDAATSRLWVGYFTENPDVPVDLAVGRALQVTLVFTPTNVAPQNTGSLRFGLFCYSDGGVRLNGDGFGGSAGNGANVTGYMLTHNFGTTFGEDDPMALLARTSLNDGNLMGTSSAYQSVGGGPDGFLNDTAFVSGTEYTLDFKVTRTGQTSLNIDARIAGGSLDSSVHVTDNLYAYRRFDSFGIRANRTTDSAEQLNFTRFKVEVIEAAVPPTITSFALLSADSAKITWSSISNRVYQVQSRDSFGTGSWITNATITATGGTSAYTNSGLSGVDARYYRVVNLF